MILKPKIRVKMKDPLYDPIMIVELMINILAPKNGLKFVRKVDCWEWSGYRNQDGYGGVSYEGKNWLVHRVSWVLIGGRTLTPGKVLDHKCKNRRCFNPNHLREITIRENTLSGNCPAAINARKKNCDSGHKLSKNNIILEKGNRRRCKTCVEERYEKEVLPTC